MSESSSIGSSTGSSVGSGVGPGTGSGAELTDQVQAAVLTVPGVARLEPSVAGGLRRFVRAGTGADGVLLVRVGDRLEVTVDIAVTAVRPAVDTATEVEAAVGALLQADHRGPVVVTVRVLSVVPPASG